MLIPDDLENEVVNQITACVVLSNSSLSPPAPANYSYLMGSLEAKLLHEQNDHGKESF